MPQDRTIEDVAANTLVGPPDEIAERIAQAVAILRPSHIAFHNQPGDLPQDRVMKSLELFGSKVMPQVERALAA